ncbi:MULTISPECIES: flagellar hook protein FlgE [unclassified Bradyrhizobium]|uniref:flagellar hook protein FlgE n=1 Tax=unclassified Bradyrhizobium TaxID=2631580 RepID=UPI0020B24EB9|nr:MULTISPECIES: flagellar hook-basal body complex protein [unclassified Bradyrhizobium]MCP3384459.1 flagellar hook-basal body complex protein [Bradyrhizobium sp. CCGUVB4N]MCP3445546.1 flagellar hook-basal body complex protein [Bradyrhizobium sp. CCGUVB14]
MGIFDAMNTSVGGLQAQSYALQNISGNIANSSTTGYKGIGTSFEDLIPDASVPSKQVAGGVTAHAQATITTQGTISSSTVATNMAITGDGFFSVQKATGVVDNVPVFNGVTNYTRRGDFQVNANGNLVNGAGYYLMGVAVDPKTGNPTGNVPTVLQFQNNFVPAQATTAIQYAANLPTQPNTVASSTAASGSLLANGGLNPSDFAANPLPIGTPATPYSDASITGTSVHNENTTPVPITTATKLSGTAPSDSLTSNFVAGNTIVVGTSPATTITITAAGTGAQDATHVRADDTVGDLLTAIGTATGVQPTINASTGAITFHTGTAQDLSITSTAPAFSALGFTSPVTKARNGGGTAGTGTVIGNDIATFTKESISGGAVTAYNAAGTPVNMQLRWAKTDSAALGTGHTDSWNLFYQTDPNATGTTVGWVNSGQTFTFASDGSLSTPTGSGITINNVSVSGQSLGSVAFNISSGGLTQYASTSGAVTINTITQNGYAAGQLRSVAVNNNGLVVGTFSNGQNLDLAQVSLSHFNGTNYLKALDGGAYAVTDQSGPAIDGASGTISGSSLEGSNTDIADEFTKLIVTQQAYSANTKVITTANSMVQDLLNVLR